jgi:putative drug exporter of the RND superfamily
MTGQNAAPRTSTGVPRWLRVVLPSLLILIWLSVGYVGGPYFGKISQVSSNDATSYLPASSDATKVQNLEAKFSDKKVLPAVVLFVRGSGLTPADHDFITATIASIKTASGVSSGVSPAIEAKDGEAAQIVVPVNDNTAFDASVGNLRTVIAKDAPRGLSG